MRPRRLRPNPKWRPSPSQSPASQPCQRQARFTSPSSSPRPRRPVLAKERYPTSVEGGQVTLDWKAANARLTFTDRGAALGRPFCSTRFKEARGQARAGGPGADRAGQGPVAPGNHVSRFGFRLACGRQVRADATGRRPAALRVALGQGGGVQTLPAGQGATAVVVDPRGAQHQWPRSCGTACA